MKKKYSTWRMEAIRTTAKASQYISHIFDLKPGPVMLFLRVSDRHQNCHLNHSEAELSWELEIKGNNVIGVFKETGPGWADDRIELEWAAAKAKAAGAVLVAETVCRFIRSSRFRTNRDSLPSLFEFERLMTLVNGARLATLHYPDTHWKEVRGLQSKRGQAGSGHRGGRPTPGGPGSKEKRRESKMPEALKLREAGFSYRRIGRNLGVAWSTVRDWIKRH